MPLGIRPPRPNHIPYGATTLAVDSADVRWCILDPADRGDDPTESGVTTPWRCAVGEPITSGYGTDLIRLDEVRITDDGPVAVLDSTDTARVYGRSGDVYPEYPSALRAYADALRRHAEGLRAVADRHAAWAAEAAAECDAIAAGARPAEPDDPRGEIGRGYYPGVAGEST